MKFSDHDGVCRRRRLRGSEPLVEHFDADKGDHASDADEFVDTVAEVVDPGHFQPEVPVYELG